MRHRALKIGGMLATLVLPMAAACGIQPTGITNLGPAPDVSGVAAQRAQAQAGSSQFVLFFYEDGRLTLTYRNAGTATNEETVSATVEGPTKAEAAQGMSSALPADPVATGGFADAYLVSQPLSTKTKQTRARCSTETSRSSVAYRSEVREEPTWNACGTADYYVPMPGDGSTTGFAAPTD